MPCAPGEGGRDRSFPASTDGRCCRPSASRRSCRRARRRPRGPRADARARAAGRSSQASRCARCGPPPPTRASCRPARTRRCRRTPCALRACISDARCTCRRSRRRAPAPRRGACRSVTRPRRRRSMARARRASRGPLPPRGSDLRMARSRYRCASPRSSSVFAPSFAHSPAPKSACPFGRQASHAARYASFARISVSWSLFASSPCCWSVVACVNRARIGPFAASLASNCTSRLSTSASTFAARPLISALAASLFAITPASVRASEYRPTSASVSTSSPHVAAASPAQRAFAFAITRSVRSSFPSARSFGTRPRCTCAFSHGVSTCAALGAALAGSRAGGRAGLPPHETTTPRPTRVTTASRSARG